MAPSANRLVAHAKKLYGSFAPLPVVSLVVGEALAELGKVQQLEQLIDSLGVEIPKYLGNSGVR